MSLWDILDTVYVHVPFILIIIILIITEWGRGPETAASTFLCFGALRIQTGNCDDSH